MEILTFFVVTALVWGGGHYYVGRRLLSPGRLPAQLRRRGWVALAAMFPLSPLTMALGRWLEHYPSLAPLQWLGFIYMGLFTLLFFLVLGLHLLELLFVGAWWLHGRAGGSRPDPARRQFLLNGAHAGALGASSVVTGQGVVEALQLPAIIEAEVPIEGLPPELDGYRIAQLSDIHVGPTIKRSFLEEIVRITNGLAPDLIAITGDLVDGTVEHLGEDVAPLAALRADDGVFFVTGNHEYYWDAEAWVQYIRGLGLSVLQNDHRVVERGRARLLVAGCTDYGAGRHLSNHASDPEGAIRGAPPCDVKVLLAHQPRSIDAAVRAGYDLQISGHTHGGQFFPITLLVGLAHPFVEGLGRLATTWIYVNRGTGYWGPPVRSGTRAEITLLRLVRGPAT